VTLRLLETHGLAQQSRPLWWICPGPTQTGTHCKG